MPANSLTTYDLPTIKNATMLLAFTGWMDGGEVSTGTVKHLLSGLDTRRIAEIDPEGYYLYNFPGSMELSALFRPHVKYDDGMIERLDMPQNVFHCDPEHKLILFTGKEPNLLWRDFGDHVFDLAKRIGVSRILFVGSFGGAVPHTREPRLFCSVSHARLKDEYGKYGVKFSDYEGPGSFVSYLVSRAPHVGLEMVSLAAEVPGYLNGSNPVSIEAVSRRLAGILGLKIDLAAMRLASDEWSTQVSELVDKDAKLRKHIEKLEAAYDEELLGATEGD
jgi:proteasome assembly chaperone (PAC2) family protein